MSPEHIRGKSLDRRTDIWAFGCMYYEAISGKPPFASETVSDTLAAVLREEPDWRVLSHAPIAVQRLIKRCLKKDPTARLHDIADAGLEIEDAVAESAPLVVQVPGVEPWRFSRKQAAVTAAAALGDARRARRARVLDGRRMSTRGAGNRVARGRARALRSARRTRRARAARHLTRRHATRLRRRRGRRPHAALHAPARSVRADRDRGHRRRKRAVLLARRTLDRLLRQRHAAAGVGRRRPRARDLRDAGGLECDLGNRRHDCVCDLARPVGLWRVPVAGDDARAPHDRRCRGRRAAARVPAALFRTAMSSSA